jgi:SNF2 family DNA or RNA helicase
MWYLGSENYPKAETFLRKSIKRDPDNQEAIYELIRLGETVQKETLILDGLLQLYERNLLENDPHGNEGILILCRYLICDGRYQRAAEIATETYNRLDSLAVQNKKQFESDLINLLVMATARHLEQDETPSRPRAAPSKRQKSTPESPPVKKTKTVSPRVSDKFPTAQKTSSVSKTDPGETDPVRQETGEKKPPEITLAFEIDDKGIKAAFDRAVPATKAEYDLVMDAVRLRFKETFDHLLCLAALQGITSLTYQEETARKILKTFRGRALLADEVGMGKTIEACIVLKEYLMRRMIKNVLILTPTPLVSQWREELRSKFALDFRSTDDGDFRSGGSDFWHQPYIVASINIAKSKKNFAAVTGREWDLVVVDEAHHLKNRNTLNWKLANSLKKRFLLMLTATPVENNLMELYNLITLLKPGQLKTASAFKDEFMTRGDPTDPRNRTRLKGLLDQVMIRNTRAVANIQIPPRFAETIRTAPTAPEIELYNRVSGLVQDINEMDGTRHRMILKHLLAEAGSSPAAVEKTLSELSVKHELLNRHQDEIRAIRNLSRSMGDTAKNRMALKLIKAADEKIIVFVKYRATLDHLSEVLAWHKIGYSRFHGQMPNAQKDAEIEKFKTANNVLLTTELGGEGRNLQFCRRMINYDLPWNPMRIEQRIGRIHRIGQTREVMIYNLCAAGTVEDYILDILDRKINMFEMVVGEIDMIVGRMRGEQDFSDMVYDLWVNADSRDARKDAFDKLGARLKRCKTGYEKTKSLDETLFGENYEI